MKDQLDYFRGSIFEAKSSYNAWKMIVFSRWIAYVGEDLAKKYTEIQNYHGDFFSLSERSFLFHWVMLVMHCFDNRKDSYSLMKISPKYYDVFVKDANNAKILQNLKNVRHSLFAHRAKDIKGEEVGAVEELDLFWRNLEDFYNKACKDFDDSKTLFDNTENVKYEIEELFYDIETGKYARRTKQEVEMLWNKNSKRISNVL